MSHRTVILSNFTEYLDSCRCSPDGRAAEEREREVRLSRFPHAVMLQASFAELDYANRWCWQQFGPGDGECLQRQSGYPGCDHVGPHSHTGKWMFQWLEKTDYNFGFSEWYFLELADCAAFLAFVGEINWGEKYA